MSVVDAPQQIAGEGLADKGQLWTCISGSSSWGPSQLCWTTVLDDWLKDEGLCEHFCFSRIKSYLLYYCVSFPDLLFLNCRQILSHELDPRWEIPPRRDAKTPKPIKPLYPSPCKVLNQSHYTERYFSALRIQTQSFLLGDNSLITTLYLDPFIISSYYKNTIR
jgi:hypothetical protein